MEGVERGGMGVLPPPRKKWVKLVRCRKKYTIHNLTHKICHWEKGFFYMPVWTYYGMVMSVRVSVRPTVRPSGSPSVWVSVRQFSALFPYMLCHFELKVCVWLFFTVLQIKFECRQFASIFVGVMPLLELRILEIYKPVFRRDVLWYGDVRPGLRPSVTVFCTFLLHTLTYWAEILHVTFFLWTFDQVRVSSISVNFCRSYAPFGT